MLLLPQLDILQRLHWKMIEKMLMRNNLDLIRGVHCRTCSPNGGNWEDLLQLIDFLRRKADHNKTAPFRPCLPSVLRNNPHFVTLGLVMQAQALKKLAGAVMVGQR